MLSRNLEQTLQRALSLANERKHEFATLEHLLLGLVDDKDALAVMRACGIDIDRLRDDLGGYLDEELESLVLEHPEEAKPTAGFQRVLQRAAIHVQSSGREEVTGANVLVALFSERESHAVYFLQEQEMTRLDAVNYISHGIAKVGRSEERNVRGESEERRSSSSSSSSSKEEKKDSALDAFCVDLNKKAVDGKIDPLIGRGEEVDRTIQILCRRTKNNP
ncbi:MAG: ATP-dependent Clp protease ATP-binding subunit ClpA, partial [Rhodospirillales bacterium]|nr:ATP-dependent Clp protease ATP-binding subunit ClpA [Rhodospirillales bacterium]